MTVRPPKYQLHKATGQARVRINGHDIYLGKYRSPKSEERYRQVIADWSKNQGQVTRQDSARPTGTTNLVFAELILGYLNFAKTFYVKDGKPTDELYGLRAAFRPLKELYGCTRVVDFGPLDLKDVRQRMIDNGHERKYINENVSRIRRMFKWGVENEVVPVTVYQALQAVGGLKKGRSLARESRPVFPVSDEVVTATLPHLSCVLQAMIRTQQLTGCRPGEVRTIRPCDVDRSGDVWVYRPDSHKTEHYGHERLIFIGPKAQRVLQSWLDRDPPAYCFSPREASGCDRSLAVASRTSGIESPFPRPSRRGSHYTKDSYKRAIARACKRAGVDHWSPNQLRHSRGTELRRTYGLEAAQTVLGHRRADVTQIYAERDYGLARKVMREVG